MQSNYYFPKLFLLFRVDDQNNLKIIKLGDTYAAFSHWNSLVLWFYVLGKPTMIGLSRGSENRKLVSQLQPDSSGLSATQDPCPPSLLTILWEGGEQVQTQGRGWFLLLPLGAISSTRHWTWLHLIKMWPLVFMDYAAKCHHCVLARCRKLVWSILHDFFLTFLLFFFLLLSHLTFPIYFFCLFVSSFALFSLFNFTSCYILRICGPLPSGSTNCQGAHSVCKSFCKDCIGTLTFILIAPVPFNASKLSP